MESERTPCGECAGEVEAGFIADVSEATVLQQTWVRGIPQKRWIGGLKVDRKTAFPCGQIDARTAAF